MPEHVKQLPNAHFYEKQWEAVRGFWFHRVLKEAALQHMTVDDIVKLIADDIGKRWQQRKAEQALYKKRKRLLRGEGPAGVPGPGVLLTNIVAFNAFSDADMEEKKAIVAAVVARIEGVAKETAVSVEVLVDSTEAGEGASDESQGGESQRKTARRENSAREPVEGTTGSAAVPRAAPPPLAEEPQPKSTSDEDPGQFDDRVAVVCVLSSAEKAATVIATLHGSKFDGRPVLCRFWTAVR